MDECAPESSWRCPVAVLDAVRSAKFRLRCAGRNLEGFVVNHGGHLYAYVNRCPHAGTTLDCWPNEFFTEDGQRLICATHGAVFRADTGFCIEGPCPGASLTPLAVDREGDHVVISCPQDSREPRRPDR